MEISASHRTASGELKIDLEPARAHLVGSRAVAVEAASLKAFGEQLSSLLDSLTGSAILEPVTGLDGHADFEITVTLDHGKGTASGFLLAYYHDARLTFSGLEIDQTYLEATRRQLHALLAAR